MAAVPHFHGNVLLQAIPDDVLRDWLPRLREVELPQGQVLAEAGDTLTHAYFPSTAIITLMRPASQGSPADTASIGREGMVGIELRMGKPPLADRVVVQSAGHALRIEALEVKQLSSHSASARSLMLRHAQALACQMAQLAICRRYHSLARHGAVLDVFPLPTEGVIAVPGAGF